jgi:hypothetical protein
MFVKAPELTDIRPAPVITAAQRDAAVTAAAFAGYADAKSRAVAIAKDAAARTAAL